MSKKILAPTAVAILALVAISVLHPTGNLLAQGLATATPTSIGLGGFFSGSTNAGTATPVPADPVKATLAKDNYVVLTSGPWYDESGKQLPNSAHVFMLAVSSDLEGADSVKQIASGFSALRAAYPSATTYHVLLLSGPNVFDASATANSLQLLASQLITPDAWIKQVLSGMRTINLAKGTTAGVSPSVTPVGQATATRAPTRVPTAANTCNAPADKARLWVKNGYSGVMRFTVGGGEWGTHDFDIPADSQYHYIDMPTGRYTYTASIPGVGKANGERTEYLAGKCYYLTFTP